MSRWLVTGATGMLGTELVQELLAQGHDVEACSHRELDITDRDAVAAAVDGSGADVVVNTAAYTRVDDAETHEADALRINAGGAGAVAQACAAASVRPVLLQVSTDYVFDGLAADPYREHDATGPRTAYGRTKLAGERAVLTALPDSSCVVRTAWLYGAHGPNFVSTMLRLEQERDTVDVVDDQHGQPTSARDLAVRLLELGSKVRAGQAPAGVYHGTNAGHTTWFGLARAVFTLIGADPARVRPTTTAAFPRPAPRPAWSVLGHDGWASAGLPAMRDWERALAAALPTLLP